MANLGKTEFCIARVRGFSLQTTVCLVVAVRIECYASILSHDGQVGALLRDVANLTGSTITR